MRIRVEDLPGMVDALDFFAEGGGEHAVAARELHEVLRDVLECAPAPRTFVGVADEHADLLLRALAAYARYWKESLEEVITGVKAR